MADKHLIRRISESQEGLGAPLHNKGTKKRKRILIEVLRGTLDGKTKRGVKALENYKVQ